MILQKQKDIQTIAERISRILNDPKGTPLPSMFWDDIDTLINLILQEKTEDESNC